MNDILGNEELKEHFKAAIRHKMVSHAYIIEGEKGSGKKTMAEAFARLLQCQSPVDSPDGPAACGKCTACLMTGNGNHPDLIRVSHEKPAVIRVDELREQLVNTVDVMPYRGPYKIYIIDEAEKMNIAAQNAVLKTIEEPPAYAVILLLVTNGGALLPTILSRCVHLHMKPVPDVSVKAWLIRNYSLPREQAQFVTGFAMGNLGKAKEAAVSEDFNAMKDYGLALLRDLPDLTDYEIISRIKGLKSWQDRIGDYLDIMLIWFRDLLVWKALENEKRLILDTESFYMSRQGKRLPLDHIHGIIKRIEETRSSMRVNVNSDTLLEVLHIMIKNSFRP